MQEKNRDILKNAIVQLPDFKAGQRVDWHAMEEALDRQEKKEKLLKTGLPVYRAPGNLWANIETKLETQHQVLKQAIKELPEKTAPAQTWENVELRLEKQRKTKRLNLIRRYAAAAILILAIGVGVREWRLNSTPAFPEHLWSSEDTDLGIEAIFNPAMCHSNPQICNSELFKLLDQQRGEIEGEIKEMESLIISENPQLMKYYHRLVNERVEIEKRMVKLIIES